MPKIFVNIFMATAKHDFIHRCDNKRGEKMNLFEFLTLQKGNKTQAYHIPLIVSLCAPVHLLLCDFLQTISQKDIPLY